MDTAGDPAEEIMRRILLIIGILGILGLFAGSVFGENNKLDQRVKDTARNHKNQNIRVIIQCLIPASAADNDNLRENGGRGLG